MAVDDDVTVESQTPAVAQGAMAGPADDATVETAIPAADGVEVIMPRAAGPSAPGPIPDGPVPAPVPGAGVPGPVPLAAPAVPSRGVPGPVAPGPIPNSAGAPSAVRERDYRGRAVGTGESQPASGGGLERLGFLLAVVLLVGVAGTVAWIVSQEPGGEPSATRDDLDQPVSLSKLQADVRAGAVYKDSEEAATGLRMPSRGEDDKPPPTPEPSPAAEAAASAPKAPQATPPSSTPPEPRPPRELGGSREVRSIKGAADAAAPGFLTISSYPSTTVWIDGGERGATPLQRVQLSAGSHEVKLVAADGTELVETVQVGADEEIRFVKRLDGT